MKRNLAKLNNEGVSLVELLIAMTILLLVTTALMQTAIVSIDSNMKNVLRDEAVSVGEMKMSELKNRGFSTLLALNGTTENVTRNMRNASMIYNVTTTVGDLSAADSYRLDVRVDWTWKGALYNHTVSTIRQTVQ